TPLPASCTQTFLPRSFCPSGAHRALHSFPTRRSSDLLENPRLSAALAAAVATLPNVERLPAVAGAPMPTAGHFRVPISDGELRTDRKSTRLNSSHVKISYAVFCLKKKVVA